MPNVINLNFRSINQVSVDDIVSTRWGNDLVRFQVTEVIAKGDHYALWSVKAIMISCDMDHYEAV